jgi:hypothetical protein
MNKEAAIRFKTHAEAAIKELSSGLVAAETSSSDDELIPIKQSVGDLIARIDSLLVETIYSRYPELDDL